MTEKGTVRDADKTGFALTADQAEAIASGAHADPFSVLGVHALDNGFVARVFIPGADAVTAVTLKNAPVGKLDAGAVPGLFEGRVDISRRGSHCATWRQDPGQGLTDTWTVDDPYSYGPVLGPVDDYLFAEGSHLRLFDRLGAHPIKHEGAQGVHFAVWAPNARRVSVVGDFNAWDGRRHVMRRRSDVGVWEIFAPGVAAGTAYKFEIIGAQGKKLPLKADPFARRAEFRPATASIVTTNMGHKWGDQAHREHWKNVDARRQPMSIYEVHPGSWRRHADGTFFSWDQLADELIPYCTEMGFTHIEFLPVSEHPYDPSWGYQTTGFMHPRQGLANPRGLPVSSTARIRSASASLSIGCLPISPPTSTAWRILTGPRSMNMPTRVRAFIPTGTRPSIISAARRCLPTLSTMPCSGRRHIMSTACAWMPSPRCSISTIPARTGSGCPTRMAGARTWKQSISCAP
jgi:1,4-alpha-glucan branching enzyme